MNNAAVGRGVVRAQPTSPMRLGAIPRLLCRYFLSEVRIDPDAVARLKELAARGTLVYVMRYRSLIDYLLVVYILLREGLPVPAFVTDIPSLVLRPVGEIVETLWRRVRALRAFGREVRNFQDRDRCQRLVRQGRPVLIFMRSRAAGVRLFAGRRSAVSTQRTGRDYLREVIHASWDRSDEVFVVPLAVLRGRGYRRKESRLATLVYSLQEAPGDVKRLVSLLWNARDSSVNAGKEVQLRAFIEQYRDEGEERIVRRLARALQIFLYREERVVQGPMLLPKRQVRQMVLQGADLVATVREVARERQLPESQVWRTAEKYFDEIAANFHGSYFTVLAFLFNRIWPRVFQGFEYEGLDRVIERVKEHPVVLVPCHRSHFDYLILSYLFHANYLSPPHIAAGINLSFWPLGPMFRGAGAYFIRRSFDGNPLYKMVFRKYLTFLIREGYTQEFFIEGGRSRTGKILTPKLGMLSAIVHAFIEGARRDLYLVPVSIHYGRIVEEEAYKRELVGAEKEEESLSALIKARSILRQKYGTVYVTFAEPISLNETLGARKEQWRAAIDDPQVEEEERRFIQKLGFRLLREVNNVEVAGATSVSSTVLLSAPQPALRRADFVRGAQALVGLLRHLNVHFTASLERNIGTDFRESIAFMEAGGLIQRLQGPAGGVIHVPAEKRMNLDFYKNNSIHFFLLPALLTHALSIGRRGAAIKDEVSWWLDMFRWEFALPEREQVAVDLGRILDYFRSDGVLSNGGDETLQTDHPLVPTLLGLLENFRECYWVAAQSLAELPDKGSSRKALLQTMRKRFETGRLLGEVKRIEGNSVVTLGNALSRFAELNVLVINRGRGKEQIVRRGPQFSRIERLGEQLAVSFGQLKGT
ncbi:MAG TPA: 1-acyl-sn-glycerol-3-phosphate acyltransferase [Candidatus Binatia bacterium]|nr:1-acyl-sn-glycerol-3-phosphate acyltransferase [Candidatus Binatia bacterium]